MSTTTATRPGTDATAPADTLIIGLNNMSTGPGGGGGQKGGGGPAPPPPESPPWGAGRVGGVPL